MQCRASNFFLLCLEFQTYDWKFYHLLNIFRIEVAIKTGRSDCAIEEMLEEAKGMIRVAKHDHIVNFQGISMNANRVYVLLEFCSFGTIESFLQNHSDHYRAALENGVYNGVVGWCIEVADAMEFLVENNIIHVSIWYKFDFHSSVI